jgi:hypothetical protein
MQAVTKQVEGLGNPSVKQKVPDLVENDRRRNYNDESFDQPQFECLSHQGDGSQNNLSSHILGYAQSPPRSL